MARRPAELTAAGAACGVPSPVMKSIWFKLFQVTFNESLNICRRKDARHKSSPHHPFFELFCILSSGSSGLLFHDPDLTSGVLRGVAKGEGDATPVSSEAVRNRKEVVQPNKTGASLCGLVLPNGAPAFIIDSFSLRLRPRGPAARGAR